MKNQKNSNPSFSEWPSYSDEEANAVRDVLLSNRVNYWTGEIGRKFEEEYSNWVGTEYAVAIANGTVALELALRAINLVAGDEVIVTPRTFIASVSCIVSMGAIPVFADVDSNSGNITATSIESVITSKTKAIICVHLAGWPCEMDAIMSLAKTKDIFVIEDCAQAHGATYKGKSVGSIGHIGCWSFCQDKIITTGGEGGMVTTNDKKLWSNMWSYKDHGKSWDAVYETESAPGFKWLHESFGTNWRMTEMQAAVGRIQLRKLHDWQSARTNNAGLILEVCDKFPELLRVPRPPEHVEHAWYKCHVYLRSEAIELGCSRDEIIEAINSAGVPCYYGSCSEVYLEKAFDSTGYRPKERMLVAKEMGETSLMFLVHPTLTDIEMAKTCEVLSEKMDIMSASIQSRH